MINEPNSDEVYARGEFMSRGGLIKPSDLLCVACSHIYTQFNFIKHDNVIKKFFLVPSIQEVFLTSIFFKRVMRRKMCIVCQNTICLNEHEIKNYIKAAATTLFKNIFAKN